MRSVLLFFYTAFLLVFIFFCQAFPDSNTIGGTNAVQGTNTNEGTNTNLVIVRNIPPTINNLGIGLKFLANFNQIPNDLMVCLSVNTPFMLGDLLAFRFEFDEGYTRGIPATSIYSNSIWADYYAYRAGVILTASLKSKVIRPYIETGFIWVFPSYIFTATTYTWGIYGLFGFDIQFPGDFLGYFMELGAAGLFNGDTSEKFSGSPHYVTGMTVSLGIRYFLPSF